MEHIFELFELERTLFSVLSHDFYGELKIILRRIEFKRFINITEPTGML